MRTVPCLERLVGEHQTETEGPTLNLSRVWNGCICGFFSKILVI